LDEHSREGGEGGGRILIRGCILDRMNYVVVEKGAREEEE
jgi:hypothetical protein